MATSEEMAKFFGGAVRYTGGKKAAELEPSPFEAAVLAARGMDDERKKAMIEAYRAHRVDRH